MSGVPRKSKVSVGDRIQQLETLVRSLLQQQPQQEQTSQTSADNDAGMPPLSHNSRKRAVSPAYSKSGSIRLHSHSANYVGSVHWTAVLDSISELKGHYEEEEEARMLSTDDHLPYNSPGPRLLYEPVQATRADILAAIPARPVVDRMIARYFNAQNSASLPILHSGHFLREVQYLCSPSLAVFPLFSMPMHLPFAKASFYAPPYPMASTYSPP